MQSFQKIFYYQTYIIHYIVQASSRKLLLCIIQQTNSQKVCCFNYVFLQRKLISVQYLNVAPSLKQFLKDLLRKYKILLITIQNALKNEHNLVTRYFTYQQTSYAVYNFYVQLRVKNQSMQKTDKISFYSTML